MGEKSYRIFTDDEVVLNRSQWFRQRGSGDPLDAFMVLGGETYHIPLSAKLGFVILDRMGALGKMNVFLDQRTGNYVKFGSGDVTRWNFHPNLRVVEVDGEIHADLRCPFFGDEVKLAFNKDDEELVAETIIKCMVLREQPTNQFCRIDGSTKGTGVHREGHSTDISSGAKIILAGMRGGNALLKNGYEICWTDADAELWRRDSEIEVTKDAEWVYYSIGEEVIKIRNDDEALLEAVWHQLAIPNDLSLRIMNLLNLKLKVPTKGELENCGILAAYVMMKTGSIALSALMMSYESLNNFDYELPVDMSDDLIRCRCRLRAEQRVVRFTFEPRRFDKRIHKSRKKLEEAIDANFILR